jgi:hypothetical protein
LFSDLQVVDLDSFGNNDPSPVMLCRRYPPTIQELDGGTHIVWPQVADDDWCGEYQAAPE